MLLRCHVYRRTLHNEYNLSTDTSHKWHTWHITLFYTFQHCFNYFFTFLQRTDVDLNSEVHSLKQAAPFLVYLGEPGYESAQYFIACEQTVLCESKSVLDSFIDLIATYYVFNIAYPRAISPILIFLQHFVFDLVDSQDVPSTTSKLITNLSKL